MLELEQQQIFTHLDLSYFVELGGLLLLRVLDLAEQVEFILSTIVFMLSQHPYFEQRLNLIILL